MKHAKILGTGSYLPQRRVTNHDLVADLAQRGLESSHEWIVERTGIHARHFAAADETSSTLGLPSCSRRWASAGGNPPVSPF